MPPAPPALDPEEVQVGTANGPGLWIAPAGTPPPADTTEDWSAPWRPLGYLSEDGPTITQSTDSETLTPWQSRVPIRTVITGREIGMQFTLWQINPTTIALYFDADPPTAGTDGSFRMELRSDEPTHLYAIGIDSRDGDTVFRIAFGRASLSDAGDMAITSGAAVPLDVTLSALDTGGLLGYVDVGPVQGDDEANGNGNGRRHAEKAA